MRSSEPAVKMVYYSFGVFTFVLLFCFINAEETDKNKKDQKHKRETGEDRITVQLLRSSDECPRRSKKGDMLTLRYFGTLTDGTVFHSNYDDTQEPMAFQLGYGEVIKGWELGMQNMCADEKRRLTIPPLFGYGTEGSEARKVPGDATLIYDVELLEINDGPEPMNIFNEIDTDGDRKITREEVKKYFQKQPAYVSDPNKESGFAASLEDLNISSEINEETVVSPDEPSSLESIADSFMEFQDLDKDSIVTEEEYLMVYMQMRPTGDKIIKVERFEAVKVKPNLGSDGGVKTRQEL